MSLKEKIPTLSDARLRALAFNAWRISAGNNEDRRKKAKRLAPLVKAELDLRQNKAAPVAAKRA